jgi:hypothetical protein
MAAYCVNSCRFTVPSVTWRRFRRAAARAREKWPRRVEDAFFGRRWSGFSEWRPSQPQLILESPFRAIQEQQAGWPPHQRGKRRRNRSNLPSRPSTRAGSTSDCRMPTSYECRGSKTLSGIGLSDAGAHAWVPRQAKTARIAWMYFMVPAIRRDVGQPQAPRRYPPRPGVGMLPWATRPRSLPPLPRSCPAPPAPF